MYSTIKNQISSLWMIFDVIFSWNPILNQYEENRQGIPSFRSISLIQFKGKLPFLEMFFLILSSDLVCSSFVLVTGLKMIRFKKYVTLGLLEEPVKIIKNKPSVEHLNQIRYDRVIALSVHCPCFQLSSQFALSEPDANPRLCSPVLRRARPRIGKWERWQLWALEREREMLCWVLDSAAPESLVRVLL